MPVPFRWSFGELSESHPDAVFVSGTLRSGALFGGRYRIEAQLGRGSTGLVLRARDPDLDRPVAIKVLSGALTESERDRFAREGELTASLRHPGIIRVHGGGVTSEGHPFLVLELIEGARDLDEALREEPERGLDMLIEVAHAVGFAHRQGVCHRDLKPENVLVGRDGRTHVCDFGLAWRADQGRLTQTGVMLGTPLFMAPEQFAIRRGNEPGAGPDVWSLGVMLYRHLTGEYPFDTTGSLAVLMATVRRGTIVPPRTLAPEVTPALERVCLRALAKDPSRRFQDAGAFADALEDAREGYSGPRALRIPRTVLAVVAVVLVSAFGLLTFRSSGEAAPRGEPAASPTVSTQLRGGDARPMAVVPAHGEVAARMLHDAVIRAHAKTGLDPAVLDAFERALSLAGQDLDLAGRIHVERLGYLFRRGRWEDVCAEAPGLSRIVGEIGARASMLHVMALYELLRTSEAEAKCRARWRRMQGRKRSATDLALGAWLRLFEDEPGKAIALSQAAQELDSDNVPALLAEARAHAMRFQVDRSRALLQEIARRVPDHPTVYRGFITLALQQQRERDALEAGEQLVALVEPDPPLVILQDYTVLLFNLNRFEGARRALNRVLAKKPKDLRSRVMLGLICMRDGERVRARGIFAELHRAAPEALLDALDGMSTPGLAQRVLELIGEQRSAPR